MEKYKPRQPLLEEHPPTISKPKSLREDFIDAFVNPNRRRETFIQVIVYILTLALLLTYFSLQSTRVDREKGVKTHYEKQSSVKLPGLVVCDHLGEELQVEICQKITSGAITQTKTESCSDQVKLDTSVRINALMDRPFPRCLVIRPNEIEFTGTNNALMPTKRIEFGALLFWSLFDDFEKDGSIDQDLKPNIATSDGITFASLTLILERQLWEGQQNYTQQFKVTTSNVGMRHNFTYESQFPATGGSPYEFCTLVLMLESMIVEKLDFYYSYQVTDLFGNMGGVMSLAFTTVIIILGRGKYNPLGLIHRFNIVKYRGPQTETHDSHHPYVAM